MRKFWFCIGTSSKPLSSEQLIRQLAQHDDVRYHEALIPFFLRHPERSALVPDLVASLVASLDAESAETLRHMYTASVYLQYLWAEQLRLYLSDNTRLPTYFGQQEFGLPARNVHFGEAGLYALGDLFEQKTGHQWITVYKLFLQRLGRCYRRFGRVYLVRGTSLLLEANKEVTRDIDLQFEVGDSSHGEFVRCLRQVSREHAYHVTVVG